MTDVLTDEGAETADELPFIPTQKDVARLAGVSPVTVSRTLAGGKNVRPDLQEKVLEAVRTLDYLPNEAARSLRPGQHSGLVGVAITNLGNPYYGTFALGVEETAAERGRYILLGSNGESATRETELIAHFISRQVEGLIVVPAGEPSSHRWAKRLGSIPLVVASREMAGIDVDTVIIDDYDNAEIVTTTLIAEGHKRIGFIGNIVSVSAHRLRYEGFKSAVKNAGLAVDPRLVRGVNDEVEDAHAITEAFLHAASPPTAILCANNRITVGLLTVFAERIGAGMSPSELPVVVCFDELELADLMPVRVRVVHHDARALGRAAATMLFDRLDGTVTDPAPRRQVLTGRIG